MEKKYLLFSCPTTLLLAHCWMACQALSDESALISIKSHFTFDPHNILVTNWTNTTSYCHWFGVTCNTTPQLMQRVVALDLSNMSLHGTISPQVGNLSQLEELYLATNYLTGSIPRGIGNLSKLMVLDLQSNILTVVFVDLLIRCRNKKAEIPVTQTDGSHPRTLRRISYHQLVQATNCFSEEFLVGKGGMSMVYKAVLSDGLVVAVKVFNLQLQGALRSFDAECKVMRNIRHRNLVKVITSCSTPDFKALVLEYMPNGSLEKQLYSHNYCLDVVQRLTIMTDVASALAYLHHENPTPVMHCDLKPNNVLLDEDMVAHVADFGIAKLFMENESRVQTKTLGTIGYMAPEYGSEGIVSTSGDVYSYGIMLMETFIRKKPTDEMFTAEVNLRSWVESRSNNTLMKIMDTNMLRREDEHFTAKVSCISSIMTLALECTTESPEERINMKAVVARLKKMKIKLLAGTRQRALTLDFITTSFR